MNIWYLKLSFCIGQNVSLVQILVPGIRFMYNHGSLQITDTDLISFIRRLIAHYLSCRITPICQKYHDTTLVPHLNPRPESDKMRKYTTVLYI